MMRSPFSVYERKGIWEVRFWNEEAGKYTDWRSTGIEVKGRYKNREAALKAAEEMLEEIQRSSDPFFLDYIESFWADNSTYVKTKRIEEKKPLSKDYLDNNRRNIRLHVKTFEPFKKVRLSQLKGKLVNEWKLWALENGVGRRTINYSLQAIRVAVRWAVEQEDLPVDPLSKVKVVAEESKEKGILLPSEIKRLIEVDEPDIRVKIAVLLAVQVGLRRGEIRGLRWGDINEAEKIITLCHNWSDKEGTKGCKWGSDRLVYLPSEIIPLLEDLRTISPSPVPDAFVFFDLLKAAQPFSITVLRRGFWRMLKNIGIDETMRKSRNITLHGMRHGFITHARKAGISDIEVQALAGHRSARMMAKYSHGNQVIDFTAAREAMEKVVEGKKENAV